MRIPAAPPRTQTYMPQVLKKKERPLLTHIKETCYAYTCGTSSDTDLYAAGIEGETSANAYKGDLLCVYLRHLLGHTHVHIRDDESLQKSQKSLHQHCRVRQHTSGYVRIRPDTSGYVRIRPLETSGKSLHQHCRVAALSLSLAIYIYIYIL
jgi:hypothetical protein